MHPCKVTYFFRKTEPAFNIPAEASDGKVVNFLKGARELEAMLARRSKHTLRVAEYIVPEGVDVYVLGTASIREGGEHALMVNKGRFEDMLLIADKEEALVSEDVRAAAYRGLLFGALLVLLSIFLSTLLFLSF